jgi:anthranilate synthase component 1
MLPRYQLQTQHKRLLADTLTPVSIYLKVRDKFPNAILLESSDYHGAENTFSYICFAPMAGFSLSQGKVTYSYANGQNIQRQLTQPQEAIGALQTFLDSFEAEKLPFHFITQGVFGYTTYDAVQYFEEVSIQRPSNADTHIPEMRYHLYGYVIAINHFKNELYLFEHSCPELPGVTNGLEVVEALLHNKNVPAYSFSCVGEEQANMDDAHFLKMIAQGQQHCKRGDVFQIVLSRRFSQAFKGDEFNVYRALRSINPSPYLFYFDYGSFKIFGSSPEAQLVVKGQKAEIHPIAGTFKRTGNDESDAELARLLAADEKENAEHVMLVDLARNDLSRNGSQVQVETFKEIQYYSHLIHLVSKVTAHIPPQTAALQLFADTFPAGTLSGAPKHRALTLINRYEPSNRGYYGGAIGFMSIEGELNHAIMIRSFLSQGNRLHYQAGAGVVSKSVPENELEEVHNKLRALRTALQEAQNIR